MRQKRREMLLESSRLHHIYSVKYCRKELLFYLNKMANLSILTLLSVEEKKKKTSDIVNRGIRECEEQFITE